MRANHWNEILRMLCMMVLADGKVYKEEVDTFVEAGMALRDELTPDMLLTRKMVLDWFVLHRAEISAGMDEFAYDNTLSSVLENLQDLADKRGVLAAMRKIALSDGFHHTSEKDLLQIAANTWSVDLEDGN